MKLLIEEYQYNAHDLLDVLDGLCTLQDVHQKVTVSYVGYYYNPKIRDVVFILPKVLVDEKEHVFGRYTPESIINIESAEFEEHERKFLYEFAVWIYRAIVVFNESKKDNGIVLYRQLECAENGSKKKKSNTLLDIILALLRFNKENRQFFTFILKNLHTGYNKINWGKTITGTSAIVQDNAPTYLRPINRKREVNFDEELLVIFFSILSHISLTYGFKTDIGFGFKLITGAGFKRYLDGYGRTRLRQIKYKYFSDTAVKLWNLCYAFFEKTYQIRTNASQNEYLLVKSFPIVFEAMIDELIGETDIPKGLKEQEDGKLVDHFYTYDGLLVNGKVDDSIYYIGDSKYYKLGNSLGKQSVYKQRTYARNVIQWNLDLFLPSDNESSERREKRLADLGTFGQIQLRDELTEGYNVIPNFFISATIDETLSYEDKTVPHTEQPPISRQFENRLYDRDTLLLSHYDVNFLFVLSLYARNNTGAKAAWRKAMRAKFRTAVQKMLEDNFDFYALTAHPNVNADEYFRTHFQETLGKTFRPFDDRNIFSLALDKKFPDDNARLQKKLEENFYIVPCPLGTEPTKAIAAIKKAKDITERTYHQANILTAVVTKDDKLQDFLSHTAKRYTMQTIPGINLLGIEYLLPMVKGSIDGYYKIERISFGSKDGLPHLNFTLGEYIPLGEHPVHIYGTKMKPGELLSLEQVETLYH